MSNQIEPKEVHGETNFDFALHARRAIEGKCGSSTTIENFKVDRTKLISAVCRSYRDMFPSIYGKKQVLPTEIHGKIVEAVDSVIVEKLGAVHLGNVKSVRKSFAFKSGNLQYVHKVVATGEDVIPLKEQVLASTLFQGNIRRKLEDLDKSGMLTTELQDKLEKQLAMHSAAQLYLKSTIERE
jgi:hypothetical protein